MLCSESPSSPSLLGLLLSSTAVRSPYLVCSSRRTHRKHARSHSRPLWVIRRQSTGPNCVVRAVPPFQSLPGQGDSSSVFDLSLPFFSVSLMTRPGSRAGYTETVRNKETDELSSFDTRSGIALHHATRKIAAQASLRSGYMTHGNQIGVLTQAAATQEAAPKTNNQAPASEYQLKTLTLWLLKV